MIRTLLEALLRLILPSTGSRRATQQQEPQQQTDFPTMALPVVKPRRRFEPIVMDDSRLVPLYLIHHEQRERRRALLLATMGVDADTFVRGAVAV